MDALFSPVHLFLVLLLSMLAIPFGIIALVVFVIVKKRPSTPPAAPLHNS